MSEVADTCCFAAPGGLFLQTQFWDTNPPTGPTDKWTIHGLWPDNCDGSWEQFCDKSRQYKNISDILISYGATELLDFMSTHWLPSYGSNEHFWVHEWGKHGTCISTFDTRCYTDHTTGIEVVDYFKATIDLYKKLDSYAFLAAANIFPSHTESYAAVDIIAALRRGHKGMTPIIQCRYGALDEIWYYFDVRGSVQTGEFVPQNPVAASSRCPSSGIRYLPKKKRL